MKLLLNIRKINFRVRKKLIYIICSLILCVSCKNFDSDSLNRTLIQGNWEQVQITYPDEQGETLITESPQDATLLQFREDSCIEVIPDVNQKKYFTYQIKSYILQLKEGEGKSNVLSISKLTEDSLILQNKYQTWKYIRKNS